MNVEPSDKMTVCGYKAGTGAGMDGGGRRCVFEGQMFLVVEDADAGYELRADDWMERVGYEGIVRNDRIADVVGRDILPRDR